MNAASTKITVTVTDDRRIIVEVPHDTPPGTYALDVSSGGDRLGVQSPRQPVAPVPEADYSSEFIAQRESLRAKLAAAGLLADPRFDLPDDFVPLSDAQLLELGRRLASATTIDEFINDEREERF